MARPKTPTAILDFRGAYKKDPQRRRTNEPKQTKPLGVCPKRLKGLQRAAWRELVANCAPKVLTKADRHALELTAVALADAWEAKTPRERSPRIKAAFAMLGKFGMNPSERAGLSVPKEKPGDNSW